MSKKTSSLKEKTISPDRNVLYKYCSPEWHPIIEFHKVKMNVKKGETIFSENDEVKGIYLIEKGKVKVISLFGEGRERILRLASDGKFLGHRGLSCKIYPVSSIALTDTTLLFIPLQIFNKLLKTNPDLCLYMIDFFAEELRDSEERVKNMSLLEVKERIASILLMLINSFGYDPNNLGKLSYALSRKDFASLAGTSYETVIRTMVYLQSKKIIRLEGKSIYILDQEKLKALATPLKSV